jgi:CRISPR-associated protein Cas6
MYWKEGDEEIDLEVPDDIVDVLFSLDCKRLPVDHAYALSAALQRAVPWIAQHDSGVGVHTIHVAGSQNGWERPAHDSGQHLILSRRTKLTVRVPKERSHDLVEALEGQTLDISGCPLIVGSGKTRRLSKETTLFSRYVVGPTDDTEEVFLNWAVQTLRDRGIHVRKALCGKATPLSTPKGMLHTRSLMLADLSLEESVRLQQRGLGPHREMGCGIFVPHKGIEAVGKST